jgi:hypothetical protein
VNKIGWRDAKKDCYVCKSKHPWNDCTEIHAEEKKAIAEAIKAGGYNYKGRKMAVKQRRCHFSVGNKELQILISTRKRQVFALYLE